MVREHVAARLTRETPMTGGPDEARRIIEAASLIIFDFDGPICAVYSGHEASDLAAQLRAILDPAPGDHDPINRSRDPLDVLRWTAHNRPALLAAVERMLEQGEQHSIASAEPTPGSHDLIRRLSAEGKTVAVASNNGHRAVTSYLEAHELSTFVRAVSARPPGRPDRMKPNPHILDTLGAELGLPLQGAALIGDSPSDTTAGHQAGLQVIGYANKPGKHQRFQDVEAIIDSMHDLDSPVRPARV